MRITGLKPGISRFHIPAIMLNGCYFYEKSNKNYGYNTLFLSTIISKFKSIDVKK